jgi:ferredoxin
MSLASTSALCAAHDPEFFKIHGPHIAEAAKAREAG